MLPTLTGRVAAVGVPVQVPKRCFGFRRDALTCGAVLSRLSVTTVSLLGSVLAVTPVSFGESAGYRAWRWPGPAWDSRDQDGDEDATGGEVSPAMRRAGREVRRVSGSYSSHSPPSSSGGRDSHSSWAVSSSCGIRISTCLHLPQ